MTWQSKAATETTEGSTFNDTAAEIAAPTGDSDVRPTLAWVSGSDLTRWLPILRQLAPHFRLLAAARNPPTREQLEGLEIEVHAHSMVRGFDPLADLSWLRSLRRQLVQWSPDVVLFTDTKAALLGPFVGRLARVPVVVRLISGLGALHSYATPFILRRRRLVQGFFRISRNVADVTVFQSSSDRRRCVKLGLVDARRSRLIDGVASALEAPVEGADDARGVTAVEKDAASDRMLRFAVRRRLRLPEDSEIVLLQTRLTRSKGLDDLIAAAPLLRSLRPNCRLVVSGARDVEALDALSDRQLTEMQRHVLWLGPRADEDDLLRAADLFVYPSFYREGVPRSLVRAARHGLPMVGIDSEPCRQIIEHGESGFLVPRNRPKRLAAAMDSLLADRQLATSLGQRAKEIVEERFAAPKAAQELAKLLTSMLRTVSRQERRMTSPLPFNVSS